MAIFELTDNEIRRVGETTFDRAGVQERRDLQRLLREHIEVIAPDTLVIAEEFGQWEDSRRRIDLLAIDQDANLVVIELKRTEDGGHMELQAVRYAAMVSNMTFAQAVDVYARYLAHADQSDRDARAEMLDFLGWEEEDEDAFGQAVRIVLASAEFSKELTSSVMWLNEHDIDMRCVRLRPYDLDGRLLVDVQQIIPLPEATDYMVQVREKARKERQARASNMDFTRFDVQVGGEKHDAMWKRNAIFAVSKHLCDNGIDPEAITGLFDWRRGVVWFAVDGKVDPTEFVRLASAHCEAEGLSVFGPRRWFCGEGQLIHANGKTYAFSNQWGGERWHQAMGLLRENYPAFKISFSPTS